MKLLKYSQLTFGVALATGALIALVLCVQCVRTYLYTDAVLVPRQAEHEAARQAGALTTAARSAAVRDQRSFQPVMEHALESASDHILWMRLLDHDGHVLAQAGHPQPNLELPSRWLERVQHHEQPSTLIETPQGKALIAVLSLHHVPMGPAAPYVLELAIPLKAVSSTFDGLRENQVIGVIASLVMLICLLVIGLRAPHYLRGKYLESELQLAKRVQSDLQPKPHTASPHLEFAAWAMAADHVGGDFYDVFEPESGRIAIVLGDVSGKGVPAALLVSVLHGAIRSATAVQHESACERINRMLCERTACERFATLFWGVFDPTTRILRYVNAGHAGPMLIAGNSNRVERLEQGGPVLGLLSDARYSPGIVHIENSDTLILYSDGITEATNQDGQEFGESCIQQIVQKSMEATAQEACELVMNELTAFTSAGVPQDDRTLLVIKFQPAGIKIAAVA